MNNQTVFLRRAGNLLLLLLGIFVFPFSVAMLTRLLRVLYRLRKVTQPGRDVSAKISSSDTPLTTVNHAGKAGDPINIQIVGTDGQVGAAFTTAAWYRADEIDLVTSIRISLDSVLGRAYSTAPVSNLYLYGRKEDLAFERPGHTVRQRDHIRLWQTGRSSSDGRPVWIGSATKDSKVELAKTNHLPTHRIAPDLDAERALVVSDLAQTGYIVKETTQPGFGKETHGTNGGGDPYFTDGQVVVLTLASVWTLPLAKQVRSPLIARLVQQCGSFIRHWLPREGQERAANEREQIAQKAQQ